MAIIQNIPTLLIVCAVLGGCNTAANQVPEDPIQWGRFDCRRLADGPEFVAQFEQAKAVCSNRSQADGMAGSAAVRGEISAAITAVQIQNSSLKACMAERGYTLARSSEHDARCPAVSPAPKKKPAA